MPKFKVVCNPSYEGTQERKGSNSSQRNTKEGYFDFDDLLPHIGEFGPFQWIVLVVLMFVTCVLVVIYMAQVKFILYYCYLIPYIPKKSLNNALEIKKQLSIDYNLITTIRLQLIAHSKFSANLVS